MLGAFLRRRCANIHMPIWIYGCMLVREEACINILLDSITACYFDTKYCQVTVAATTIMVHTLHGSKNAILGVIQLWKYLYWQC